jgi:excinuclease ABC subunit A
MSEKIILKNVSENNLKNIDIEIPKNKLVVLTGISGSGKSSIAFSTIHKMCQYEYMKYMGGSSFELSRPKVGHARGLSPSICVNQVTGHSNIRSTVGTITDIYTYLRFVYAKLGEIRCECGQNIPSDVKRSGIIPFDGFIESTEDYSSKKKIVCEKCGKSHAPFTMRNFSFNKPEGACKKCSGIGYIHAISIDKILDPSLTLFQGAVLFLPIGDMNWMTEVLKNASVYYGFPFDVDAPVKDFCEPLKNLLLYGVYDERFTKFFPDVPFPKVRKEGKYEGIVNILQRRYEEKINNEDVREKLESFMIYQKCPECDGDRLSNESRNVFVGDFNISQAASLSLDELLNWLTSLEQNLDENVLQMFRTVFGELRRKIENLIDVGLGYLSLMRSSTTLSMGEVRRIKLSTFMSSTLTGILYVLDEPTVGLHQRDTSKLISLLRKLRDMGNTVLVVEHDVEMMREADYIIEVGPLAGSNGGRIVNQGRPKDILKMNSLTAKCLATDHKLSHPERRKGNGKYIEIVGAKKNNLKNISAIFPLETMIGVTGVSGSGKSSLIFGVLKEAAENYFSGNSLNTEDVERIEGLENISRIVTISQTPIGLSPRSNIATYTGIYSQIRKFYAELPYSVENKLQPKHFSFNVAGGRCEHCQGAGVVETNMQFTDDNVIECPVCHGKRFTESVLNCKYNGYSISDVLDSTVDEVYEIFDGNKSIQNKLKFLKIVGLGYIRFGQTATTLSGGEAQRIKLSKELSKKNKGNALYIFDEPTTGLHPYDVQKFIKVLNKLVDSGNTVIVIEHNLDVIKYCDILIDIGPEGGDDGGKIIVSGTPEQASDAKDSITGQYLKRLI